MRKKLKIEEKNKNRNATYVRNDFLKKEKLQTSPKYSVPVGKRKKNEADNTKPFLKNTDIFTRHCACDIQNLKSRAWRNKFKSRLLDIRRNLLYVVLHKDFSK